MKVYRPEALLKEIRKAYERGFFNGYAEAKLQARTVVELTD